MGNAKIPACFIFYLGPYACHHSTVPCVASTQRGRERVSRMLCLDDAALCGPYVCYVRQHQVIVVCVAGLRACCLPELQVDYYAFSPNGAGNLSVLCRLARCRQQCAIDLSALFIVKFLFHHVFFFSHFVGLKTQSKNMIMWVG